MYFFIFLLIYTIFTINFSNNYVLCDSDKKYIEISKKFYYKSQSIFDISKTQCNTIRHIIKSVFVFLLHLNYAVICNCL